MKISDFGIGSPGCFSAARPPRDRRPLRRRARDLRDLGVATPIHGPVLPSNQSEHHRAAHSRGIAFARPGGACEGVCR